MKRGHTTVVSLLLVMALCALGIARAAEPKPAVLITNANVFDGENAKLAEGMSVLVEGNKITKIAKSIPVPDPLQNLDLVADPEKNFALIMKDGKIYKNTVK